MIKRTMIATGVALAITTTLTANIALAEEETPLWMSWRFRVS